MRNHRPKTEKRLNILPSLPYQIAISIAERDLSYKNPSDARWDGWRPIWSKCWTEFVDHVLDEEMRERYLDALLDYAITLPMVCTLTKKLKMLNTEKGMVAYCFYGLRAKPAYRVGVELIKMPVLTPDCFSS